MNVPQLRFDGFEGEWNDLTLGELGYFMKGMALSKADISEEGEPCILYGELYTKYGAVVNHVYNKTNSDQSKKVFGTKNDVLIPSSGETAIDIACASALEIENVLLGGDLNLFRPKNNVSGSFLSYQINGVRKFELSKLAQGASVVHLYSNSLKKFMVKLPTFEEQQKIASFLKSLDKKIEMQQEKIEKLEQFKKGMMQKIFSQELRFKNQNGEEFPEWEKGTIGDAFKERSERKNAELELLAVTINSGVMKRSEIEKKDSSSSDKDNYKTVYINDIVYNSMRMWQGASGVSEFNGIVSPAYTVLSPMRSISSHYFSYLFKTKRMIQIFQSNSQGLTSDTWNLKYPALSKIKINIPSFEEQKKIANYLKCIDQKLEKEKEKMMVLREQKNGFMQEMFV